MRCVADCCCSFLGDAAEDPIPELQTALVGQHRGEHDMGADTGDASDLLKRMTAKERCAGMHSVRRWWTARRHRADMLHGLVVPYQQPLPSCSLPICLPLMRWVGQAVAT